MIQRNGIETDVEKLIRQYRSDQNEDNVPMESNIQLQEHMHPHMSHLLNEIKSTKLQLEQMKRTLEVKTINRSTERLILACK